MEGQAVKVKTILLVEDDVFLSNLLMTRLQKAGLRVIKAMTGEEALNILRGNEVPDLILLDIILPQKSGFEVLEEIQSDPNLNKAPIIITSNLGQESDVQRGKQLGVISYFIKAQTPIDKLVNEIQKTLDKQ
jgi:CheY-like chemotaxis protein